MTVLHLNLEGDGAWPDLLDKVVHRVSEFHISALAGGMSGGSPSVSFRIDLPTGEVVLAETSLALLLTAADALKARYGDPRR